MWLVTVVTESGNNLDFYFNLAQSKIFDYMEMGEKSTGFITESKIVYPSE